MVDRRRDARRDVLRELDDKGVSCPVCGSTHFCNVGFDMPKPETPSSDRRADVRAKPDKPDKPHAFIRATCGDCGNVLFFDPDRFGPPKRYIE
jgi:ribosomal protein S27E